MVAKLLGFGRGGPYPPAKSAAFDGFAISPVEPSGEICGQCIRNLGYRWKAQWENDTKEERNPGSTASSGHIIGWICHPKFGVIGKFWDGVSFREKTIT